MAAAVDSLSSRLLRIRAVAAIALAVLATGIAEYSHPFKEQWRETFQYVLSDYHDGDIVKMCKNPANPLFALNPARCHG
jgi:hypothetical protein